MLNFQGYQRWLRRAAAMIVLHALGFLGGHAVAQEPVRISSIKELRDRFRTLEEKPVVLRGWVSTEKKLPRGVIKGFYLKDRFGSLLLIRTTGDLPEIGAELIVTGPALRDAKSRDIYVLEEQRTDIDERELELVNQCEDGIQNGQWRDAEELIQEIRLLKPGSAYIAGLIQELAEHRLVTECRGAIQSGQFGVAGELILDIERLNPGSSYISVLEGELEDAERRRRLMISLGVGIAVLGLGAIVLIIMRRRGEDPGPVAYPVEDDTKSAEDYPTKPVMEDYKTVRVYKTTKTLPGKLAVLEDGAESDVFVLFDQTGKGEVDIGRDSPDVSSGIRIKDDSNTLSRRQARLTYDRENNQFRLKNLAGGESNPTIVDGKEMAENTEITISEGQVLTMGSVKLKFRAN